MAGIFISHSSADNAAAEQVRAILVDGGYEATFLDFDPEFGLRLGQDWMSELLAHLRAASAVVYLGSPEANESRWCHAELVLARSLSKPIVPLIVRSSPPHPVLGDFHAAQVGDDPVVLRRRLLRALEDLGVGGMLHWDVGRSPYPGLRALDETYAAVFFGREAEVERLRAELDPPFAGDSGRLVAVVGSSGSGKSSLVRAGLVPRLRRLEGWFVVDPITPSEAPCDELAIALSAAAKRLDIPLDVGETRAVIDEDGLRGYWRYLATHAPSARPVRMLLVVDQAEELVTLASVEERDRFLRIMSTGLTTPSPLRVAFTIKSEFIADILETGALAGEVDDTLLVGPLDASKLGQIIAEPADAAAFTFEPGLVERLVADTGSGQALPFLAFTLQALVESGTGPNERVFSHRDYERVGGVAGAITAQADAAAQNADDDTDRVVEALLSVVSIDDADRATARRAKALDLDERDRTILDVFVGNRLLVRVGDGDDAVYAPAHEALFRAWAPLSGAIDERSQDLRRRARLERQAADWHAANRSGPLLGGESLSAAVEFVGRAPRLVTPLSSEFITESSRVASRARRRRRIAAGAFAGLLGALALVMLVFGIRERDLRDDAETQRVEAELQASAAEAARESAEEQASISRANELLAKGRLLATTDPRAAALALIESEALVADPSTFSSMIGLLMERPRRAWRTEPGVPLAVAIQQGGDVIAVADATGPIHLLSATTLDEVGRLVGHEGGTNDVAFVPNSRMLVSSGEDGIIRIWDPETESEVSSFQGPADRVLSIAIHSGGDLMASGELDGTVRLWSMGSRDQLYVFPNDGLSDMVFDPVDSLLWTVDGRGGLHGWDTETGEARFMDQAAEPRLLAIAFDSQGRYLVRGLFDGAVELWSWPPTVDSPVENIGKMNGHVGAVSGVAFDPVAEFLATISDDLTARLWSLYTGEEVAELAVSGLLFDVAFTPEGASIIVAEADTIHRFETRPMAAGSPLLLIDAVNPSNFGFGRRGAAPTHLAAHDDLIAAGTEDGHLVTLRLGGAAPTVKAEILRGLDRPVVHAEGSSDVAFSQDGGLVATAGWEGTIKIWDVGSDTRRKTIRTDAGPVWGVEFTPSGDLVATLNDGTLGVWDIDSADRITAIQIGENGYAGLALDPIGRLAATSGGDTIKVWDLESLDQIAEIDRPALQLAFSPDGRILAAVVGDEIGLFDPSTGLQIGSDLIAHSQQAFSLAFNPEGTLLATGGVNLIHIWDVATQSLIGTALSGHSDSVTGLAFVHDGNVLASAALDGSLRFWDLDLDSVLDRVCAEFLPNLTEELWHSVMGDELPFGPACAEGSFRRN